MPNAHKPAPLAAKLRPKNSNEFFGQSHLLNPGSALSHALEQGSLHSMILWGPPGSGKTTLANLLVNQAKAEMHQLSAVLAGVKDIRSVVDKAKQLQAEENTATVLFVDEIHRFNKAQQDAFLPFVEDGTITLIGATTENPSFALNNALLSRCRVYVLKALDKPALQRILDQALASCAPVTIDCPDDIKSELIAASDGDARRLLTLLELMLALADDGSAKRTLSAQHLQQANQGSWRQFDKQGDIFYDQISALHKSIRGSNPDASLYWFYRMIDAGCDPNYIARRLLRLASEDIGNADPRALSLTLDAWQAFERLGSPEGELALAQAVSYLAVCPKSNAVYLASKQVVKTITDSGSLPVPEHLRYAPTKLAKSLGHGKDYRYAHDEPEAYAAGVNYFPEQLTKKRFYQPSKRGLEAKIASKLEHLATLDKNHQS